jgi:hypothetical protein
MRTVTGLLLLSALLAGCSSTSSILGSSSSSSSSDSSGFGDAFMDIFNTKPERPALAPGEAEPVDVECPQMIVRDGASTLTVNGPGEPSAMTLRYQGTIGRLARNCVVVGKTTLAMKVGMEGHIILGPLGGPGKVDVPLRFAVVREGPNPQTIMTRTYRKQVEIPPGASNVSFAEIDDNFSFPLPASLADLDNYVVYVGFDPESLKKPAPRKSSPRRRRTP